MELVYVGLLFALFILPRTLQRVRIPTAVTSFALGGLSVMALHMFHGDPTVGLLSTLGIVALFLFAGLDVEVSDLRSKVGVLLTHVAVQLVVIAATSWVLWQWVHLPPRTAALTALALFTPSTGFILDSLDALGSSDRERFWIRSKAIATELVALGVLFVILQSTTLVRLGVSALALAAMIALLPVLFRTFATVILPYAPKSEFAFLIMVAVICALATRALGVYYLVGAFVVGMAAQALRARLPAMASEKMIHAVEAFASLFVPFYFFHAGLELRPEHFQWRSLLAGGVFLAVALPLRVALVGLHRHFALKEPLRMGLRVSVPMLPTLVFTLVLAQIMHERFDAPRWLFGGLVVYAIVNTLLPGLVLRRPYPEFDSPHAPPLPAAVPDGDSDVLPNPS